MPCWPLIALLPTALATGDAIRVDLLVDDREARRLSAPQVLVEQEDLLATPLLDDGTCPGDLPGDKIFAACFQVQRRETLTFGVLEGDQRLGSFNLFLPNASEAAISLRSRQGVPALLLDMAAETPLYAPTEQAAPEAARDRILVMVSIDDSAERVMTAPVLEITDRDGVSPVSASDEGLLLSDQAHDGVWRADIPVLRTPTLSLALKDEDELLGEITFALPASQRSSVTLVRRGEPPILVALSEAELAAMAEEAAQQGPETPADHILVMVSIDDTANAELQAPTLEITDRAGVDPVTASDDGLLFSDEPGDGVWRADVSVLRTPTLSLALKDEDELLGEITFALPASQRSSVTLVRRGDPPALVALGETGQPGEALTGDRGDTIVLSVEIDDRAARLLEAPMIRAGEGAVDPVGATDDGSVTGDTPGDHIYNAVLELQRTPSVELVILEAEAELGAVSLVLPSTDAASVRLRTRTGSPAIMKLTDPQAPSGQGAGSGGSSSAGSLMALLWINLALFAVFFAWARKGMRRAVRDELQPVIHKLQRSQAGSKEPPEQEREP